MQSNSITPGLQLRKHKRTTEKFLMLMQESKIATFFGTWSRRPHIPLCMKWGKRKIMSTSSCRLKISLCFFIINISELCKKYINISVSTHNTSQYISINASIHQYRVADCTLPHEGKRVNQLLGKKVTQNINHKNEKRDINDWFL